MDRAWIDEVLKQLGPRYRGGAPVGDALELLYRAGRSEFRSSRFVLGGGDTGRSVELTVDVRIPKEADPGGAQRLIDAFESKSAGPRGFTRADDTTAEVHSEKGAESGSVRTLKYRRGPAEPAETAKQIRAIVESIDIPITVGIHEPEHVVARDAAPPRPKTKHAIQPMELWEYQLEGGLLRSLTVVVDPNDRTLKVVERKLISRTVGETLKLAQVAKFSIRRSAGSADLIAVRRDGAEVKLLTGSGSADFVATAGRLAKKVFIPIEGG